MYCKFKHQPKKNSSDEEIWQLKCSIIQVNETVKSKEEQVDKLERIIKQKNGEIEKLKVKFFEQLSKVRELENEIQSKNEAIAVNNMLHDDFKERMVDKYLYESDDELSDYEPDIGIRESNRFWFWKNKLEKRFPEAEQKDRSIKCKNCEFVAKSESGLKTHLRTKHKEAR